MKVFSAAVALLASSAPAISADESAKHRAQQQQDDTDTAARNLAPGGPPEKPVGAEPPFVGTYYLGTSDAPGYNLTFSSGQYLLRQVQEGTVTEITSVGDAVGDYQPLNIVRGEDEVVPAVGLGSRTIIGRVGDADAAGKMLLDGSIVGNIVTDTRLASISPCVCDTAEYSDPFELTKDLTIETKAFFDTIDFGFKPTTSFVCTRLVRQGEGWIGLGINPGRPENDSELAPTFNPPNATKNAMQGSQAVIGTLADGDQPQAVLKYHLNGGTPRIELFPPDKQTLVCPSTTYNKQRDETTMVFGKYLLEAEST